MSFRKISYQATKRQIVTLAARLTIPQLTRARIHASLPTRAIPTPILLTASMTMRQECVRVLTS